MDKKISFGPKCFNTNNPNSLKDNEKVEKEFTSPRFRKNSNFPKCLILEEIANTETKSEAYQVIKAYRNDLQIDVVDDITKALDILKCNSSRKDKYKFIILDNDFLDQHTLEVVKLIKNIDEDSDNHGQITIVVYSGDKYEEKLKDTVDYFSKYILFISPY